VRQAKLAQTSWTIQPGQSLTSRPEQNFAHMEVTKYAEPKERQIVDHNESEGIEPRNVYRMGSRFYKAYKTSKNL